MSDLRCPACRHPVDVPDDHFENTIRCGICWAEVDLGDRMVPVALAPADVELREEAVVTADPPAVESTTNDVFAGIPGFAVKGHGPLEEMLRRVVQRVPALFIGTGVTPKREMSIIPADIAAKLPAVPAAVPALPEIQTRSTRPDARRDDDDIRRPRRVGTPKRMPQPDEDSDDRTEEDEPAAAKSAIGAQIAILAGMVAIGVLAFYVVMKLMN